MRDIEGSPREVTKADVLIIGGGFAGAWAALRAKDFADKVVLVDKAKVAKSGCSTFAAGIQLCPTTEDNLDMWKREIVESADYFPDQEWVDLFLRNQIERIRDYERWGALFERNEKGNVDRIVGRGHINTRLFQFHGPELIALLRDQMLDKGVELVERTMITDLLTSDGAQPTKSRVVGAVGFNTRNGAFHVFKTGAIVMAAGPMNAKLGGVEDNLTGDGVAAAFRAGAEVANMEFCTRGNITVWERKGKVAGINMIQGHGAYFVNVKGERFMDRYEPMLRERAALYKICMAFGKEALEGRGPIYVDMRHFSPQTFEKFRRVLPRTMKFWDELGVDVSKDLIECTPSWGIDSAAGEGGIKVDAGCATNIPGLYAAGAVTRNPIQGIYSVGGVATASCNVMGYIAGENAAKYADTVGKGEISSDQVQALEVSVFGPLQVKNGLKPADLFDRLNQATIPAGFSMFKHQGRILKVLGNIQRMKEDLSKIGASSYHELVKAHEFRNCLECADLVFRAALERKESRHYHYREDYPYRDDSEWLKLIVFKRDGERLIMRHEPIPIDRWQVKPPELVKIYHPVQIFMGTEENR